MNSITPYRSFETAAAEALQCLRAQLGFQLWMVTRVQGDDWIVLNANDRGYGVSAGDVFQWTDSFCSQMVQGNGPRIAPRSDDVPAYLAAPIGQQVKIGAYVGIPLTRSSGELFGTLCAIDPKPQSQAICDKLPLFEMIGRLLSTVLEKELIAEKETRRADRATAESQTDSLTGLYNRRGWDSLVSSEESRCQRYGHAACVFSIDLDNLKLVNDEQGHGQGDELLRDAAKSLLTVARQSDICARLGGDEFGYLAVECSAAGGQAIKERLEQVLGEHGVLASIGFATRGPGDSLSSSFEIADQQMYACKNLKK